jgi:hypothetical protein
MARQSPRNAVEPPQQIWWWPARLAPAPTADGGGQRLDLAQSLPFGAAATGQMATRMMLLAINRPLSARRIAETATAGFAPVVVKYEGTPGTLCIALPRRLPRVSHGSTSPCQTRMPDILLR